MRFRPLLSSLSPPLLLAAVGCATPGTEGKSKAGATVRAEAGPAPSAAAPTVPVAQAAVTARPAAAIIEADALSHVADAREAKPSAVDGRPRVYAKTRFVWIRGEPDTSKQWIGYLWSGGSAPLHSTRPVYGPGCETWYAVEPVGFVCVDGLRATLDAKDQGYRTVARYAADTSSPWPHRYGEAGTLERKSVLPGAPLSLLGLPSSVHDSSRNRLRRGSTVAYVDEVRVGERDFLLTADLSYVEKADVVPYPRYEFAGVELGGAEQLPLAFFRAKDRPKWRKGPQGLEESGESFLRLSHVRLSGQSLLQGGERFLETADGGFVRESDAVVPAQAVPSPFGEKPPEGRATWIEVSVGGGWLIAYEHGKPVYTTLISPGRGGAAKPNVDPLEDARTPLGTFPITGKFATASMEAPGNLIHDSVPFAQNFSGPYALHTAYWHDGFGEYKSGGCVNLSPIDGKRMYDFTDPKVPEGWHGMRWLPWRGPATRVVIHR